MADKGNDQRAPFSPAFASLLNKANSSVPKPNFGLQHQKPKPNFGLSKLKDQTVNSPTLQPTSEQEQESTSKFGEVKPITFGTLESQKELKPRIVSSTPFANLINKNKETRTSFGTSALEKLSAKYLNSNQVITPKFGSSTSSSAETSVSQGISCPIFERNVSSPADQSNEIRPLTSALPTSKEIQIPRRDCQAAYQDPGTIVSPSGGSSDFGSPTSKFTFSPIPNKTQSPGTSFVTSSSPNGRENKLSSFSKLKDRYAKNARVENGGSPNSPSMEDTGTKRFTFDLSSALVSARKDQSVLQPNTPNMNKILTPQRRTQEHTIVVDQLSCLLDARALLEVAPRENAVAQKRMSQMGKVICKKWKGGTFENIPVQFRTRYHIPRFKFDTLSPDDEIQAKFKRRR